MVFNFLNSRLNRKAELLGFKFHIALDKSVYISLLISFGYVLDKRDRL